MLRRQFTTVAKRLFEDSSKKSAVAIDAATHTSKQSINHNVAGNSFSSFKEYRKSAIQHGPLRKNFIFDHSNSNTAAIWTNERDYGVSEQFKNVARSYAYNKN